ncbi:MAG: hypothetical protein IBJ05_11190, partial [Blastomonas sp.]|nr:hypothetical protein [Blastomonas sp.]
MAVALALGLALAGTSMGPAAAQQGQGNAADRVEGEAVPPTPVREILGALG